MFKSSKTFLLFFVFSIVAIGTLSAQSITPTFHSFGIYYSPKEFIGECEVNYRVQGDKNWKEALPLWYDKRNKEYRGSIVNLSPSTTYEVQLFPKDSNKSKIITSRTWAENFPIAKTIYLEKISNKTLKINESGTSEGYILYTYKPDEGGTTIDVNHERSNCVEIAEGTSFIIIRGLTLKGAAAHGMRIFNNCHDIVIEENDISGWGSKAMDGWGKNRNSAIFSAKKHPNIERIIIQKNKLHHPATDANSWVERRMNGSLHPAGPQAIHLAESNGNHVIRYNEIYSDSAHYFNDAFGAAENYSFRGFPNKDSDIYSNSISHCWDDGIESEGANENVRIWDNYIDKTYVKIAIATVSKGPLYIWRNIANTSRKSGLTNNPDEYERGPFIKAGGQMKGGVFYGGGRTYVFHNTLLQAKSTGTTPLGCGSAIKSSGGKLYNVISRNNIFLSYKKRIPTFLERADSCTNDFDYDFYTGGITKFCNESGYQKNGRLLQKEFPKFDENHALIVGSIGIDAGIYIPNFSDNYLGEAPDVGAVESIHTANKAALKNTKKGSVLPFRRTVLLIAIALGLIVFIGIRLLKFRKTAQN